MIEQKDTVILYKHTASFISFSVSTVTVSVGAGRGGGLPLPPGFSYLLLLILNGMTFEGQMRKLRDKFRIILVQGANSFTTYPPPFWQICFRYSDIPIFRVAFNDKPRYLAKCLTVYRCMIIGYRFHEAAGVLLTI